MRVKRFFTSRELLGGASKSTEAGFRLIRDFLVRHRVFEVVIVNARRRTP